MEETEDKTLAELALALLRAREMIRNGVVGEDAYGEVWIKRPDGWEYLDRLTTSLEAEVYPNEFDWIEVALCALLVGGEIADTELEDRVKYQVRVEKVISAAPPGMLLDLVRLK